MAFYLAVAVIPDGLNFFMPKGLPYFKFFPTEWLTGDIVFEPFDLQGCFINICAIYWQRDGILSIDDIDKRFKATAWRPLIGQFLDENNGFISIKFLDEQLKERGHISAINSKNGKKGAKSKSLKAKKKPSDLKRPLGDGLSNLSQLEEEEEIELKENKNLKIYRSFKHLKISNEEFDLLLNSGYTKTQIDEILDSIENYKKNINYTSLYLTASKWLKKEHKEQSKPMKTITAYEEARKNLGL